MSGFKIFVRYELWVNVPIAIFLGAVFTDNLVASQHGAISDLGEFSERVCYFRKKFAEISVRRNLPRNLCVLCVRKVNFKDMASVEQPFAEMYLFEWMKELKNGCRFEVRLYFMLSVFTLL